MKSTSFAVTAAAVTACASPALSETDVWQLLDQITIQELVTETSYEVRKTYPPALARGAEIAVEITGYATPALPGDMVRELLLVSDMGLCPLCGSADHGATLVVSLADEIPVIDDSSRITLRGTLSPVTDPETWQSVVLKNATIVTQ